MGWDGNVSDNVPNCSIAKISFVWSSGFLRRVRGLMSLVSYSSEYSPFAIYSILSRIFFYRKSWKVFRALPGRVAIGVSLRFKDYVLQRSCEENGGSKRGTYRCESWSSVAFYRTPYVLLEPFQVTTGPSPKMFLFSRWTCVHSRLSSDRRTAFGERSAVSKEWRDIPSALWSFPRDDKSRTRYRASCS